MEAKLARITQLSTENPNMVFTSVRHFMNGEMLKECHSKMDGDKVVGNDGTTKEEYGRNLDVNLENLVNRLKWGHIDLNRPGELKYLRTMGKPGH